jgi:hypothetical protein
MIFKGQRIPGINYHRGEGEHRGLQSASAPLLMRTTRLCVTLWHREADNGDRN